MADEIDPQKVPIDPDEIVIRHIPKDQLPDITAASFVLRNLRSGREKGLSVYRRQFKTAKELLEQFPEEKRGRVVEAKVSDLLALGFKLVITGVKPGHTEIQSGDREVDSLEAAQDISLEFDFANE